MNRLITSQLVAAISQCRRKAYFLLRGNPKPHQHQYEGIVEERATRNRSKYLSPTETDASNVPGPICSGDFVAQCDAVERSSRTKGEPHLVIGTHQPTSNDKLRLAFAGYTIGEQGRSCPTSGVIVPSGEAPKRVKLETLYPTVRKIVANLRDLMTDLPPQPPAMSMGKHCQTCPFHDHCLTEAVRTDSLFLLDKMTPKLAAKYQKKGILTLTQLSYLFKPRRRRKGVGKLPTPFNVELQALAIRTKKIYLHERPALPQYPVELFLDIEGIPDQDFNYLIGVLVKEGEKTTMHSFWADTVEEESRIFTECLDVAAKYPDAPIYHYGSYERRAFERAAKQQGIDCEDSLRRMVNVNGMVYGKVYFPTQSNGLKDLGVAVGASWSIPSPSGIKSVAWRYRWEDTGDDDFKTTLLGYNQADCNALRLLTAELQALSKAADSRLDVDFADSAKQLCTPTGDVIHRAFDGILTSGHENYDCRRIKRTEMTKGVVIVRHDRRHDSRPSPIAQRHIAKRVAQEVRVPHKRNCPRHPACRLLPTERIAEHSLIHLAFTQSGCHKKIIKYIGKHMHCPLCNRVYPPPAIKRLHGRIFGHAFQAWGVYQRIVMRLPLAAVSETCDALFSEYVNRCSVNCFVRQFAEDYAPTERLLLTRICESPFIHVDETKLNIRGIDHFAWGLTDGRHVAFRLTETRETTLVRKLLGGYDGVLVSDFYGGYDCFPCRQQKCLVHLIRDLNDDLWKNPFLEEYELFVARVRDLLMPIFEDVERFGLKKRHLQKHMKSVERFYQQAIDNVQWVSEIVQKYQKRFVRYRESLFLFLLEDGIPWNNNMAERALRHLAIQRKISQTFYATGAANYLRLLGIAQSCRFQNKSFLRFLLSQERDVDEFKDRTWRGRSKRLHG